MDDDIILIVLILILPLIADIYVKSSYKKYLKVGCRSNLTGVEIAQKILKNNDLSNIYVVETNGTLSDHYDPKRKVVRLSNDIFHGSTVASVAVAAHECGHAIQDKEGYFFLKLRSFIYPIVNIATSISYYIIIIGFVLEILDLVYLGIGLSAIGLLFQIITLPVEFNASRRAEEELEKLVVIDSSEIDGIKKMLRSAALTYVAGVLASALQILRLILASRNRD